MKLVLIEHDSKASSDSKEIYSALLIQISRYDLTFGKKFPTQGDSGSNSWAAEVSTSVISSQFACENFRTYLDNMVHKNNWCSLCLKQNLNANLTLTLPMTGNRREALCRAVVTPPRQLECSPSISVHWSKYGTWQFCKTKILMNLWLKMNFKIEECPIKLYASPSVLNYRSFWLFHIHSFSYVSRQSVYLGA